MTAASAKEKAGRTRCPTVRYCNISLEVSLQKRIICPLCSLRPDHSNNHARLGGRVGLCSLHAGPLESLLLFEEDSQWVQRQREARI